MSNDTLKSLISELRSYNLGDSLKSLQEDLESSKVPEGFLSFYNSFSKLSEEVLPHIKSLREKETSDIAKKALGEYKD